MARIQTAKRPIGFAIAVCRETCGFFLPDRGLWMPSEIKAITRWWTVDATDRGVPLRCGEEPCVELALAEALNNAVVHGNRMDRQKLVQILLPL